MGNIKTTTIHPLKSDIENRKKDHLVIATSQKVQVGSGGFENFNFIHNALPEIDFDEIDLSTKFLGKKVNYPFFISSMTGGTGKAGSINEILARQAEQFRIPMGVGSQRVAIVKPEYEKQFREVRKFAPTIPIMANVGLVQLNYGFGIEELKKIIDMVQADALIFHLNPIQEVIQPEGDRNFDELLPKLHKLLPKIPVPVIIKEVGFGLSYDVAKRFYNIGVKIFDTAGWGGTNWALVEGYRGKGNLDLAKLMSNWGIPTAESIVQVKKLKDETKDKEIVILGSGGVRSGMDIAKCIALGADMAGLATPFAKSAMKGEKNVENIIEKLALELKTVMFGIGVNSVDSAKMKCGLRSCCQKR